MGTPASAKGTKVGILGGGQLARMLVEGAKPLGLEVRVLCAAKDDPAARLAPASLGTLEDPRVLRDLYTHSSLVTFENEFVDTVPLVRLAAEFPKLTFQPSLVVLERLQDKLNQKEILDSLGIPTAKWKEVPSARDWGEVAKEFPKGAVLKWARMGYDGKGLLFFDPAKPDPTAVENFFEAAAKKGARVYAEEKIPFRRELALVGCRSASGAFAAYPLVQSRQERGICKLVTGPAVKLGNSPEQETRVTESARRLMEALGYVGALALELFESDKGDVLVNEIAPRVHNSGHYTQDAGVTSQFENHWRAVLGLPLGETKPKSFFAMLNLLGPEGISLPSGSILPAAPAGAKLHWYEKKEIRSRRKMAHLNATATSQNELDRMVKSLEEADAQWAKRLAEEGKRREQR
jgi:5-(carboxyamino)imidazole ribonucleotide synthase